MPTTLRDPYQWQGWSSASPWPRYAAPAETPVDRSIAPHTVEMPRWHRMAAHTKLIVNPAAGNETALEGVATIEARLRARGASVETLITRGPGDAAQFGARAVRDGCETVVVAGGDGTLNEVLNGVAQVPGGLAATTFGVLPLGTGNDFATAIGVPDDLEAALDRLLDAEPGRVDVGRLNGRVFLNISAGGFIAEVSDAVGSQMKTVLGRLAYLVGGAQALVEHEPVHARVMVEDGVRPGPSSVSLQAFAVCNSRLIGGGRLIAPHAVIDDGWLDVCLIHAMPMLEFVALLRRVSAGEHVDHERVGYFRARRLELAFDAAVKVNTDGQVLEAARCQYEVLPQATRVLLPR
jgi:diacylglycerol kinase (ATP)